FDAPQKQVRLLERFGVGGSDQPFPGQFPQGSKGIALPQARSLAAMEELQRIDEELDLPNSTRAELDVLGAGLAANVDLAFDPPQRLDDRQVQAAAPDEGRKRLQQPISQLGVAGNDPGLDERGALPRPTLRLVVTHGCR